MNAQTADDQLSPLPLRLTASARSFIEEMVASANFSNAEEVVELALTCLKHHMHSALQDIREREEAGASLDDISRSLMDS